jgi:DNA-binding transcriptional MerR regulator
MSPHTYSIRDVERVLRLSRSTIRGLIEGGFVAPARGPRQQYQFSFQDLIVLRAARALIEAKVPRKRIRRSLEDLRRHLPETVPLSGLSISAVGDRVVVRDGQGHFQVDDGQYVLGFDVSVEQGVLRVVERKVEPEPEPLDVPMSRQSKTIPRTPLPGRIGVDCSTSSTRRAKLNRSIDVQLSTVDPTLFCCSISACYSRTWVGRPRHWKAIKPQSSKIRILPTATTTWRDSTKR